jgi:hypothetical protein
MSKDVVPFNDCIWMTARLDIIRFVAVAESGPESKFRGGDAGVEGLRFTLARSGTFPEDQIGRITCA